LQRIRVIAKFIFIRLVGKIKIINDSNYAKILYWIEFGRMPDLKRPETFNENISRLKILKTTEKLSYYTDKFLVRDYIKKIIGKKYLNDLIGYYNDFDEINFDILPDSFVIKCTHASGYNAIVKDKSKIRIKYLRKIFQKWLRNNYYHINRERNYYYIKPGVICEKYLDLSATHCDEFKLFCFNGRVELIQHIMNISNKKYANNYNNNWNLLNLEYGYPLYNYYELPDNKDLLIELAEKLATTFKFVRVDFYAIENKIFFGELTFHPGGGHLRFKPDRFDKDLGRLFSINK